MCNTSLKCGRCQCIAADESYESVNFVFQCEESLHGDLYNDVYDIISKTSTNHDSKVTQTHLAWWWPPQAIMSSSMSLSFINFLFLVCQSCLRRPQFYFLLSSLPSFLPTFVLCISLLCITHRNEHVGCSGWRGGA